MPGVISITHARVLVYTHTTHIALANPEERKQCVAETTRAHGKRLTDHIYITV